MKFSSALDIARYYAQIFLRLIVGVFHVLFTLTFSFFLLPSVAWTATPVGTVINNRAQVIYTLGGIGSVSTSSNVDQFTISALNTGVSATLGIAIPSGTLPAGNSTILNITITNPSSNPLTGGHLSLATPAGSTLQLLSGAGVVSSENGYSIPDIIANGSLVMSIRLTVPLTQPHGNLAVPISYQATGLSPVSSKTSLAIKARTRSTIEFLQYDASGNSPLIPVGITQFSNGSSTFTDIPPLTLPGGGNIRVTDQPVSLMPANGYHKGQTFFVRVSDPDHNADSNTVETINVNVTDIQMGDSETLRLKETGPDTGIFTGYISSTAAQTIVNNGSLSVTTNDKISIRYADIIDTTDAATASVLVDPYGVVFNSSTGQPVNGVEVRFINNDTGLPAVVFGDDGVSSYPATVITGGQVTDSSGAVYQFPAGSYRFPFATPGNYRLEVKPPNSSGYTSPSSAATSAIQSLPGAPFSIDIGSRSEIFFLKAGPPLRLDLPIDPIQTPLFVRKTANKNLVANGDFLQYGIDVENITSLISVPSVEIVDLLPHGFRFQSGSAKINNIAAADPVILPDGRTLKFMIGNMAPSTLANLSYVVEVAVAQMGKSTNQANAQSNGALRSNLAEAAVDVREDLMRSRSILMGRVIVTEPGATVTDDPKNNNGLAGVRIYLEDGSFAVSDKRGMFHFEGIRPGTHVVQLDLDTVPEKYEVIPFEENTRSAGRAWSKFIDVQGGTMWRVDFHVALKPRQQGNVTLKMGTTLEEGEHIQRYQLELKNNAVPLRNARLMVMLPEGATYVAGSSSLDDRSLPDPEIMNGALTYVLDNIPGGWQAAIAFKAVLGTNTGNTDALTSKAMLIFDTPTQNNQRTPIAENTTLKKESEASRSTREFTFQPTFSPLDVSLNETDKNLLNAFAEQIKSLENISVTVTGHTDNSQVLRRSRSKFSDNHALSIGRATSVARYLMEVLHLTPEQITTIGRGQDEPVASNKTDRGRALNRRVEIRVTADKVIRNTVFQPSKIGGEAQAIKTEGLLPGETWQRPMTSQTNQSAGSTVQPSYDASWLETAPPGVEWLVPDVDDLPSIPSLNITLKHAPDDKVTLLKDGVAVSNLNFDRMIKNTTGATAISYWRGIPLTEGDNRFDFVAVNALGEEIARVTRIIHYSSPPVRTELIKDKSSLLADGLTAPVIAVRLLDRDGHPAREGISGEYMINPPYRAAVQSVYKTSVMPGAPEERNYYKIGKDGVALIKLDPTTEVGEVKLRLPFYQGTGEINARLIPKKRDWILVGFAEGTAGYNILSGNTQPLRGNAAEEHLYQDGRVALYAKGRVDSKWLLTMAYDSKKQAQGSQPNLFGTINPGTYYTLYGDSSTQRFDSASRKKVYLKIERDEFYALFGDFNTNLTTTELSRYNRSITGLKAEYNDEKYKITMFASQSGQVFKKDEIRGEGTSGLYRLSSRNIVINSEKIRIETRDRFRSEVILSSRALSRNSHYTINYDNGTLFFREPVFSTDENLNHVFIVVDYESNDGSTQAQVYGGRAEAKVGADLTLGVTHINEGKGNVDASLSGIDMKYQFTPETGARLEYAHSAKASTEDAYLAQIEHRSKNIDGKAYLRQVDSGFGLGQINNSESGTRKMGVEGIYRLFDNASVRGNIYRQSNLATGAVRDFVESQGNVALGDTSLRAGLRSVTDTLGTGEKKNSELITAGVTQKVIRDTLSIRADREQPIGAAASADFPARTRLGADYKISADTSLFAEQEWANGALRDTQNTRIGLKTTPWTGGEIFSAVTQSQVNNTASTLANMGLRQRWKINPEWSADAGLEQGKTLNGQNVAPLNTNVPFASGTGTSGDFTAASVGTS